MAVSSETFYLVQDGSELWKKIWDTLAAAPINAGLTDPRIALDSRFGEAWQYMGSRNNNHWFRHRCHPKTQQLERLCFQA